MGIALKTRKHVLNDGVAVISAYDKHEPSGSYSTYQIFFDEKEDMTAEIKFQNGTVLDEGINGVNNESLLEIVAHRLECFQSGEFRCRENAIALTHIQEAILWLHERTSNRVSRGVEGKEEA